MRHLESFCRAREQVKPSAMAAAATEAPIALGQRLASVLISLRTATPETPPAELTRLQSELRAVATEIRERSQHPDAHEAVLARSVARGMLLARTHPPDTVPSLQAASARCLCA